jgi:hypothetical protein
MISASIEGAGGDEDGDEVLAMMLLLLLVFISVVVFSTAARIRGRRSDVFSLTRWNPVNDDGTRGWCCAMRNALVDCSSNAAAACATSVIPFPIVMLLRVVSPSKSRCLFTSCVVCWLFVVVDEIFRVKHQHGTHHHRHRPLSLDIMFLISTI